MVYIDFIIVTSLVKIFQIVQMVYYGLAYNVAALENDAIQSISSH